MPADSQPDRIHALDAVRGFALTLGVFFHASMSFVPGQQIWFVMDTERSPVMTFTFFVLHIFRMTTFFIIAGFFGRMMLERRGAAGFMRDRGKRIGLPLVLFWLPLMASFAGIVIWFLYQTYGSPEHFPPAPAPRSSNPIDNVPLTHMWFLYLLLWFYAAALGLRWLSERLDRGAFAGRMIDGAIRFLARIPGGALLLGLPFAVASALAPSWMMYVGIPTPDNGLIPNPQALVQYGLAFGFGWFLHRQIGLLKDWERAWPVNLGLAVALSIGLAAYNGPVPVLTPAAHDWRTAAYAVAYGFAAWAWAFGLIGAAMRFLSGHSPWRRYLADASYWIYIVHLPLVMALQTIVAPFGWPWFVKYALIIAVAFPIMLATYEWFVRYSWLGAILNGRRAVKPGRPHPVAPAALQEAP